MPAVTLTGVEITDKIREQNLAADGRPERLPLYLSGSFESGDTNEFSSVQAADLANQFAIVQTPTPIDGVNAARFRVRAGDVVASGERIEVLQSGHRWANNEETFHFVGIQLPVGFVDTLTGTQFKIFNQAHDNSSIGSPNYALRIKNGNFDISYNTGTIDVAGAGTFVLTETFLSSIQKGIWYRFVVQTRWRTGATGLVRIWRINDDGSISLIYEKLNIITLQVPGAGAASQDCYIKAGMYRNIFPDTYTDDIYQDGFRIGRGFWDIVKGRTRPHDRSISMYPAARNMVPYFNCQVGSDWIINGVGSTAVPENIPFVFEGDAPWRCHVTTPGTGTGEGVRVRKTGISETGKTYVATALAQRVPGQLPTILKFYMIVSYSDATSDTGTAYVADLPLDYPQRFYAPPVVANPAKTVTSVRCALETSGAIQARQWYVGGVQIEDGLVPTSVIPTFGTEATRPGGRIRFSNQFYRKDQGFCIIAFRSGFDWTNPPGGGTDSPRFWIWGDNAGDAYQLYWAEATNNFNFRKTIGGVANATASVSLPINRGGNYICACTWNATSVKLLVLDCYRPAEVFTSASGSGVFTNTFQSCDIGRLTSTPTSHSYLDFFYAIAGQKFLLDSDVDEIAAFGIDAPRLNSLPSNWLAGAVISGLGGGEYQSIDYLDTPSEVTVA